MAEQSSGGKPGPALTVGIPLIILAAGGFFAYMKLIKPALDEKDKKAADEKVQASTSVSGKKYGKMIKVAGDPWSGYSTFRSEPKLAAELGKSDIGIEYIDDEKLYDQSARMEALASGKIDLALTTLDAFLQHGAKRKGKDGLYPGVIVWNIDESNGGDAIFLAKDRKSFDDVKPSDKVCYSAGTPSEHLWDFASLSFANLGDNLASDNGVVAKDCWEKLKTGKVQVAVLWQPFTAIAAKEGYSKVFATGGQADDVIVDIAVANRDFVIKEKDALGKLARAYFKTIDGYTRSAADHGKFITADCGADCGGDAALGTAVLEGIDFLTYEENMCLWWGHCGTPAKMLDRIGKTGRLLAAKGKLTATDLPEPTTILNDSLLAVMKKEMEERMKLAAEVAGKETKTPDPAIKKVEEKKYEYAADIAKSDKSADVGTLNLPSIYFQEGSYVLDQNAKSIVETIAEKLRSFPALCVKVYGHTNSVGSPAANKSLSDQRARSIAAHLQSLDPAAFPAARFDVRGFGSEQPILKGGAEDRDASRRTEFKLFNCPATAR
jgi:outer membrane protein OmpA-like peptidoglycan-associated protein/ABC-type amino acid transport substrate-binding protein